jgi:hypothetical protein
VLVIGALRDAQCIGGGVGLGTGSPRELAALLGDPALLGTSFRG